MNAEAEKEGLASFTQAKATAPLRAWMRQFGNALMEETPDFRIIWERVFEREMKKSEEQMELAAGAPPVEERVDISG